MNLEEYFQLSNLENGFNVIFKRFEITLKLHCQSSGGNF